MDEFVLKSSKPLLRGRVFDVRYDRAEHPSGTVIEREIAVNSPSAVMLARNELGQVLLVRQYRLPPRRKIWELPAGRRDSGESILETAQRELREETGYQAARWTRLLEFYPAPGFASELMTAFLAEDLTPGESSPEPYELIETLWVEWPKALEMIQSGDIRDAKTIATIFYCDRFKS